MRIIGGKLRSRKFDAPPGKDTRPTADRAKVALFNILQDRLNGAQVLDAFAGSGALAFEALSRGAAMAVLFEENGATVALLRENVETLGLEGQADIWRGDFLTTSAGLDGVLFNIVFLDPPYASGLLHSALIASERLLAPGGVIVAEHSSGSELPDAVGGLMKTESRRYGAASFSFYKRREQ